MCCSSLLIALFLPDIRAQIASRSKLEDCHGSVEIPMVKDVKAATIFITAFRPSTT